MTKIFTLMLSVLFAATVKGQSDSVTVAKIDGELYRGVCNRNGTIVILNHKGKSVLLLKQKDIFDAGDFEKVEFKDFDKDGYKDLVIAYRSNVPEIYDLFLYNKSSKKFIQVKEFSEYPNSINLKGTNLFYSYHRSGCADEEWDSDLFKIVNFKVIKIGNINGRGCDDKPKILITKITGKHESAVKEFPITEIDKFKDYKWGFIVWYWRNNYKKFTVLN